MALEGIGSLVQALAEQVREAINSQPGASIQAAALVNNRAIVEDTFTPSAQNIAALSTPQDAGIFQVSPGALSAVTANILSAQSNPNLSRATVPLQNAPANAPNAGTAQQPNKQNANLPAVLGQLFAPGQAPPSQTSAASTTSNQVRILALNAALPALGLSKVEIEDIDRIAARTQNFNPTTYTDLINQFKSLTQQEDAQAIGTAQANGNGQTGGNTAGNQNTPSGPKTSSSNSRN